jgi:hypothetical protein
LEEGSALPLGTIYPLSLVELEALRKFLDENPLPDSSIPLPLLTEHPSSLSRRRMVLTPLHVFP